MSTFMSKESEKVPSIKDSFLGKVVILHPNKYPFKKGKRYCWKGDIDELKEVCAELFGIHSKIVKICTLEGKNIHSIDQVETLENLVPLCKDEEIAQEKGKVPLKIKKVKDPCERPIEELDKIIGTPYKPPPKMKKEPIEDKFNYYVGMSKNSVERVLRLAEWSTFSNLSEKDQNKIVTCDVLRQNITNDQLASFHKLLVEQDICGTESSVYFENQMSKFSAKILRKMEYNDASLVLTGPRFSGKTTFLNNLAITYFRKLVLAGLHSSFLYIPINFDYNKLIADNCYELYDYILTACFQGINFCCLQLLPAVDALYQWFKELPYTTSAKKLPPILKNIKGVTFSDIEILGKTITKEFHFNDSKATSRTDTAEAHMMEIIANFPSMLASALGFESPLFIIDHIETCGEKFCGFLANALNEAPYIVATKDDQTFFSQMNLTNATVIDMEGIVTPMDNRKITMKLPETVVLNANDCLGCPGYLALFTGVCNILEAPPKVQRRFSQLRTSTSASESFLAKRSLFSLVSNLIKGKCPKLNAGYLGIILESEKCIGVVSGKGLDLEEPSDKSDEEIIDDQIDDKSTEQDDKIDDKNDDKTSNDIDDNVSQISSTSRKQKPPPQYFASPDNASTKESPKGSDTKSRKAPSIADFPETLEGYGTPTKTPPSAHRNSSPKSPKGSTAGSPKSPTISIIALDDEAETGHKHSNKLSNWESDDEPPVRKRKSLPAGKFRPGNYWA